MTARNVHILVVDDEKNIRTTLQLCLEGIGAQCVAVGSVAGAAEAAARGPFDVAFVDLRLGTESGLDVIPALLGANPQMAIVIITAYATVDTAVEAMKRGAWDYLAKPFTPTQIRHMVDKAEERRALAARVCDLEEQLSTAAPEATLDSASPTMRAAIASSPRRRSSPAERAGRGARSSTSTSISRPARGEEGKPWKTSS